MPLTVPEYIEVQNSAGDRTAFLSPQADGLKECWLDCRLNEECTLNFLLPMNSPKWEHINAECRIIAGGREFVILRPDALDIERDQQGKIWGKIMAHESWTLLRKQYPTVSNDPQEPDPADLEVTIISGGVSAGGYPQGSAGSALSYLLEGSGWTLDTCDVGGTHDLETEKESLLSNIQKVQEIWGGYLVWDSINKTISLRDESKWQEYNGFQIRYAKNLKHITRTDNFDIVTRLYPFGENDLDISSVNGGVKYLENFDFTSNVYVGTYQNQDIDDPQELKDKGNEALEKMCNPRYTYKTNLVDIRALPEYQHEDFKIGDIGDVIDEELSINIQARIMRHRYNIFQPWKCDLEIGEPEERLAAKLSDSFETSKFIKEALKPNPATSNLLKGFIDTFATQINSANGKLVWNDSTLEAIEIDGDGNETGNRVRVTPGGVGVSTDGGQTYDTAMTGAGVLANKIIVNELYALATDDGFTKLMASGLHVYDESQVLRVIVGWWMENDIKRFGTNIKAEDGSTTLLDDRGLLQTWQEGRSDNVDSTHPVALYIYLPPETRSIKKAILRFKLLPFRAYAKGASSGGGGTETSSSGGGSSETTSNGGGSLKTSEYPIYGPLGAVADLLGDWMSLAGAHNHGDTDSIPDHNHGISSGTELATPSGGSVTFIESGGHYHDIGYDGDHAHERDVSHQHDVDIPDHAHDITIPDHTHSVSIPSHTHGINYGIYTSLSPADVTIKINGVDKTSELGGPFNTDQSNINISSYLSTGQWNTIELGSSQLGRFDTAIFIQALMGVA